MEHRSTCILNTWSMCIIYSVSSVTNWNSSFNPENIMRKYKELCPKLTNKSMPRKRGGKSIAILPVWRLLMLVCYTKRINIMRLSRLLKMLRTVLPRAYPNWETKILNSFISVESNAWLVCNFGKRHSNTSTNSYQPIRTCLQNRFGWSTPNKPYVISTYPTSQLL